MYQLLSPHKPAPKLIALKHLSFISFAILQLPVCTGLSRMVPCPHWAHSYGYGQLPQRLRWVGLRGLAGTAHLGSMYLSSPHRLDRACSCGGRRTPRAACQREGKPHWACITCADTPLAKASCSRSRVRVGNHVARAAGTTGRHQMHQSSW